MLMRVSSSGAFKDLFSAGSKDYARFRPTYPPELFDWIAAQAPQPRHAVDVGTGNGQAAVALADRFERVTGIDPSEAQLRQAAAHPRVQYVAAPAEATRLPDGSADALTVAQALHWFDHPAFFAEAHRVLGTAGVLVAWSYALTVIAPEVDQVVHELYEGRLGKYWEPERRLVETGYRTIAPPDPSRWRELSAPPIAMTADWTLGELLGYLGTWSALARCRRDAGEDPLQELTPRLARAWGDPDTRRRVSWPLSVRAFRRA